MPEITTYTSDRIPVLFDPIEWPLAELDVGQGFYWPLVQTTLGELYDVEDRPLAYLRDIVRQTGRALERGYSVALDRSQDSPRLFIGRAA
jgi:hypothetical protein